MVAWCNRLLRPLTGFIAACAALVAFVTHDPDGESFDAERGTTRRPSATPRE